jgi:hypothetical protein
MAASALPLPTPKWDGITERAARLRIAIQPVCFARVSAAPRISVARVYKSVPKPHGTYTAQRGTCCDSGGCVAAMQMRGIEQ